MPSASRWCLSRLTNYFAFYNAERPHQSLGNQTPQEVHVTSSGWGTMFVDKYRTKETRSVALRSSGVAFEEVRNDIWPLISNTKTGAALSSWQILCTCTDSHLASCSSNVSNIKEPSSTLDRRLSHSAVSTGSAKCGTTLGHICVSVPISVWIA